MNAKFMKVIMAIGNCIGMQIPTDLAKKMMEVRGELIELAEIEASKERKKEE